MPVIDAGFIDEDKRPDHLLLVAHGPTAQVVVGAMTPVPGEQELRVETVYALIDSGATESCIDCELAKRLGLPIVDVRTISGVSGAQQHDVYAASVSIPGLEFSQYGQFTGVELEKGGQHHRALLGRTFLSNIIMIYDGLRAQVTLAAARVPATTT